MDAVQILQHELAITQGKLARAYMSIERVRQLHTPRDGQCSYCYDLNWSYEGLDNQDTSYPCPTIKALDGETNV